MAATITSCKRLIGNGESAEQKTTGESETATYQLEVTQFDATPLEVARATFSGYPAFGSTHAINTKLKVVTKNAKRAGDKAKNFWNVTVTWDVPASATISPLEPGETPNSKNIQIQVTGQETCVLTNNAQDTANTPIRNAVGDFYPDPIEMVLYDEVISISFEALAVNFALASSSRGKINNAPVSITLPQGSLSFTRNFPKHTLLLRTVDYQATVSKVNPTATVWGANVVIVYREDTWNKALPQKGYRWKDENGNLTDWKDHPEYLAADGKKLGSGVPIIPMSPVQQYKEANLAALLNGI